MKSLIAVLAVVALCSCAHRVAATVPQSWQDGFVLDHQFTPIGTQTTGLVSSWANVVVGKATSHNINASSFHIASNGVVYLVACIMGDPHYPCPNITVRHRTIVSVESTTLHILDDDGKDCPVPILEKVAENGRKASIP